VQLQPSGAASVARTRASVRMRMVTSDSMTATPGLVGTFQKVDFYFRAAMAHLRIATLTRPPLGRHN
jgi:hypothetical protein